MTDTLPVAGSWPEISRPRALRIAIAVPLLVAFADFLLWGFEPGAAVGVFAMVFCACAFATQDALRIDRAQLAILAMIAVSAAQAAIETGLANIAVLAVLLVALNGCLHFGRLRALWMRVLEVLLSFRKCLAMPLWLTRIMRSHFRQPGARDRVLFLVKAAAPALLLLLLFIPLLGSGNAVLGQWLSEATAAAERWLTGIAVPGPLRFLFWIAVALSALVLLQPLAGSVTAGWWSREFPRPRLLRQPLRLALVQSLTALATVNLLFVFANGLDALFLWRNGSLPAGVTYASYVHNGVDSLIVAVIVSAVLLGLLFQQPVAIIRRPLVKLLGLLWIAQNLFLLAGVALRLKLYVDAYWLTPKRVYVALFLLLVAVGYALLASNILRRKGLKWLLLGNAVAVLTLFFAVQFANVRGFVADYNLALWRENPERDLGREFYQDLGPHALPVLIAIAESPHDTPAAQGARAYLDAIPHDFRETTDQPWQSFQWRHHALESRLAEYLSQAPAEDVTAR